MAGAAQLFGFTGVSATLFGLCLGIGAWLEKEADDTLKNQMRQSLKAATWFSFFQKASASFSAALDCIFGVELLGWQGIWVSCLITTCATLSIVLLVPALFILLTRGNSLVITFSVFFGFVKLLFWITTIKLPVTLIMDYLTLLRTRYFCRRLHGIRLGILPFFISLLLDIFTFFTIATLGELTLECFATGCTTFEMKQVYIDLVMLLFLPDVLSDPSERFSFITISVLTTMTNAFASLLPSLVFYIFLTTTSILHLFQKALSPIATISKHLTFKKPFITVGVAAGIISGGIASAVLSILTHYGK